MTMFWQRLLAIALIVSGALATSNAQLVQHVQGEVLVQLMPGTQPEALIQDWQTFDGKQTRLEVDRLISKRVDIWLLRFDYTAIHEEMLIKQLNRDRRVLVAQLNHLVTMRETEPNDTLFADQWQYVNTGQSGGTEDADIDMDEAWDITTGGTTITGDTIVVAALDDGVDLNHEDLQANRWVNHAEIPDNGIDDDNNGYVDDYQGWSIITDDDNVTGGGHGTPVAGIIGADGNNSIGVSGVSWTVKVMIIKNNFNTNEAAVLEAYSYALEQRMLYNETGGGKGAFVVATNASWGVDFGDPEDAPIWCSFYDVLGAAGILNCGATINGNVDVDIEGDLPTACASDFMISVTNMNHNDVKVTGAGYGVETIDLGAFGANAYTLANNNGYGGFGGTSGATPHVAGAIGLLYSADCPVLAGLTQADPAAAALLVREAILNGVDPNASLDSITTTGGRLNVARSLEYLLESCDGCIPASSLRLTDVIDTTATLNWNTNDSLLSVDLRWRLSGEEQWDTILNASSPYVFDGLTPCAAYEYEIRSNCSTDTLGFNNTIFFSTDGCCEAPAIFGLTDQTGDAASFEWSSILAINTFEFRYRPVGDEEWTTIQVDSLNLVIDGLASCTEYEYQLRGNCDEEDTDYSEMASFLTSGCGPCLDQEYCTTDDLSTEDEYIAQVTLGDILDNVSGLSSDGYQDFGPEVAFIEIEQGATYPITLVPGFVGQPYNDAWRVWVDFDQNGEFTSGEVVFSASASPDPASGEVYIPADAPQGLTRMRVLMQFLNASSSCPTGNNIYGEIEDYCVEIVPTTNCAAPGGFLLEEVDTASATVTWETVGPAIEYTAEYRMEGSVDWLPIEVDETSVSFDTLTPCTPYYIRVFTTCSESESESYSEFDFVTECIMVSTDDLAVQNAQWTLAPNPTREVAQLLWRGAPNASNFQVMLTDAFGRRIQQFEWAPLTESRFELGLSNLPSGVYWVQLYEGGQLWSTKRVVKLD